MASTNEGVGNNSFKGKGTIRCGACGKPTKDHPIARPCPEMGVEVFHVERPHYRGLNDADAKRQREYRARLKREQRARQREGK